MKPTSGRSVAMFRRLLLLAVSAAVAVARADVTLRVRLTNGSIQRMTIPSDLQESKSLREILWPLMSNNENKVILNGNKNDIDESQTLAELDIQNGALITLVENDKQKSGGGGLQRKIVKNNDKYGNDAFVPFPDLAKDYKAALQKHRRNKKGSGSYTALAELTSAMHTVEPQAEGPLKRIVMCQVAAERFQANESPRCALLLGSVHRERLHKKRAKTSLSSTTEAEEYCQVAKVHAVYEQPYTKGNDSSYDTSEILQILNDASHPVQKLAKRLDIKPVGWLFSYTDSRSDDKKNDINESSLPVLAGDVWHGAKLQINKMKTFDRDASFVTLAMEASTGATEAFQLSDVAVQMVSEQIFEPVNDRYVQTTPGVVIDGRETSKLDSVLCLVNTAMLGHEGLYSGAAGSSAVKRKDKSLTNKARKKLLQAIDDEDNDKLLSLLCDFSVLLSLSTALDDDECDNLCTCVKKYSRGQKKGTKIDDSMKRKLELILSQ